MSEIRSHYRILITRQNVLVPMPVTGDQHLIWKEAHSFTTGNGREIKVPGHFQDGAYIAKIGNELILVTRHWFEFTEEDMGKSFLATVQVVRKTNGGGKQTILLNITKADDQTVTPQWSIKFPPVKGSHDYHMVISGATPARRVKFIRRGPKPRPKKLAPTT